MLYGKTALHVACCARNTTVVGYLLSWASDLVHIEDNNGRTPLFDACRSGSLETVEALLQAGAKVNISDNTGLTALHSCTELAVEQRFWTREDYIQVVKNFEYPIFSHYSSSLPYVEKLHLRHDEFHCHHSSWLCTEGQSKVVNLDLCVRDVVRELLAAGADISAEGGDPSMVPIEYAREFDCQWMVAVLDNPKPDTATIPKQPSLLDEGVLKDDVLRNPWKYMSLYRLEDIAWLRDNDANFFGSVAVDEQKYLCHIYSFTEAAVLRGLTGVVLQLGNAVRYNESQFTQTIPVDKWTLEIISQNRSREIPYSNGGHWDPDRIK